MGDEYVPQFSPGWEIGSLHQICVLLFGCLLYKTVIHPYLTTVCRRCPLKLVNEQGMDSTRSLSRDAGSDATLSGLKPISHKHTKLSSSSVTLTHSPVPSITEPCQAIPYGFISRKHESNLFVIVWRMYVTSWQRRAGNNWSLCE